MFLYVIVQFAAVIFVRELIGSFRTELEKMLDEPGSPRRQVFDIDFVAEVGLSDGRGLFAASNAGAVCACQPAIERSCHPVLSKPDSRGERRH